MKTRMRGLFAAGVVALTAAATVGLAGVAQATDHPQTPPTTSSYVVATWAMPSWKNATTPVWPQTLVSHVVTSTGSLAQADLPDCGYLQVDVYNYTTPKDKADVDALIKGGVLKGPSNPVHEPLISGGLGTAWTFLNKGECTTPTPTPSTTSPTPTPTETTPTPTPTPDPIACTPTGDWYTEDIAPQQTDAGLLFTGQNGTAVNWLHPATGNFQGFTGATYTLADVAGYQTAYRFVIWRFAGSTGYASVTVEPYMNGWTSGQSGTFAITPDSLAWSSKIASGPGSQSEPVALSQFGTIWPDNQFISIGFHLGSSNTDATHSLVTKATGCIAADFVKPTPSPSDSTTPSDSSSPSPSDSSGSPSPTESSQSPSPSDSTTPPQVVTVTPVAPGFLPPTCKYQGTVTIPPVAGVAYSLNGTPINSGVHFVGIGTYTVTAEPADGYVFAEGATTSWTRTFTAPACSTSASPSTSFPETGGGEDLPKTGGSPAPLLGLAGVLLALGLGLMVAARRKGAHA